MYRTLMAYYRITAPELAALTFAQQLLMLQAISSSEGTDTIAFETMDQYNAWVKGKQSGG